MRARLQTIALAALLPLAAAMAAASQTPPTASPAPPAGGPAAPTGLRGWKRLTLKTEPSPLYTGSITLELSDGTHAPAGRPAVILKTHAEARVLGAIGLEERTTSWIDAQTRRPLELFQMRP